MSVKNENSKKPKLLKKTKEKLQQQQPQQQNHVNKNILLTGYIAIPLPSGTLFFHCPSYIYPFEQ